jgi:hypothetical protein
MFSFCWHQQGGMAAGWNLALFYLRTLVEVDWKGKDQSIAKFGDAQEVNFLRGFRQGYPAAACNN